MYKKGEYDVLDAIVDGLEDKKGQDIVVVDLRGIGDTICKWFVICQGGSPAQVHALAMSVGEKARQDAGSRPLAVDGLKEAHWVAMDYADVMVHIFLPVEREFYDLEHLWADAEIDKVVEV